MGWGGEVVLEWGVGGWGSAGLGVFGCLRFFSDAILASLCILNMYFSFQPLFLCFKEKYSHLWLLIWVTLL